MVGSLGNIRQMALGAVVLALVALVALLARRRFAGQLEADTDSLMAVSAAILSVYGIVLGLTLAASWERFQMAEDALVTEANGLYAVSRLALSFAGNGGEELQRAVIDYANTVVANELTGGTPEEIDNAPGTAAMRGIYEAMLVVGNGPGNDQASADPSWTAIVGLDAARGIRLMLDRNALPVQFWVVLIFGAVVSILSLIVILPRSGKLHVAVSVAASTMIVLMLLLLSDLNRPFEGPGTVDFSNYRAAVRNLEQTLDAGAAP